MNFLHPLECLLRRPMRFRAGERVPLWLVIQLPRLTGIPTRFGTIRFATDVTVRREGGQWEVSGDATASSTNALINIDGIENIHLLFGPLGGGMRASNTARDSTATTLNRRET